MIPSDHSFLLAPISTATGASISTKQSGDGGGNEGWEHTRASPVLAVVMAVLRQPRALPRLLLIQDRQQAKDDGNAKVELDAHQAARDGFGNVFKVDGVALDQDANGEDGVEGASGGGGG